MPRATSLPGGQHTSKEEEDHPVGDQDRPEHGDVEEGNPGGDEAEENSASGPVPELKLGKAADEGPELLILPGGESSHGAILHLIIDRIVRGVNLGRQECQEQVEEIDGKGVGDCMIAVSSLRSISCRLRIE